MAQVVEGFVFVNVFNMEIDERKVIQLTYNQITNYTGH